MWGKTAVDSAATIIAKDLHMEKINKTEHEMAKQ